MALILSLDSTTLFCSVALHEDGKLIKSEVNQEPRVAASLLAVMVNKLLAESGINSKNLASVAVSSGPGSYTGLRIATSIAKGLCFSLEIPLIAINSLQILTRQLIGRVETDIFCPMIDARRMEVYCALVTKKLEFLKPTEAKVLDKASFEEELKTNKIAFFGDGSEKFKNIINHTNAIFVESIQPNAADLGYLAYEKFKIESFEDSASFEPYYLKDFIGRK